MTEFALPNWLHWLESCPSTNTWALQHLAELKSGDVVFTPHQTAGRGQHGRVWYAPIGVLTASFVIDGVAIEHLPSLSLIAGLATIYAIEDLCPSLRSVLQLKWTNDVMLSGKKLAGILCESVIQGTNGRVVVGIGVNRLAQFDQSEIDSKTLSRITSLHEWSVEVPTELQLLERLRYYLLQSASLSHSERLTALLPAIRQRDFLLGKTVEINSIVGTATGISDRGYLQIRLPDGSDRFVMSGHVHFG